MGRAGTIASNLADDLGRCIVRIASDPIAVAVLFVSIYMIYTNEYTPDKSFMVTVINKLRENDKLAFIGDWINSNKFQFLGLVAFAPTLLALPAPRRPIFACIAMVWIYCVPEGTPLEYAAQSILLLLFLCAHHASSKIVMIILLIVIYGLGYIKIPGFDPVTLTRSRSANATPGRTTINRPPGTV